MVVGVAMAERGVHLQLAECLASLSSSVPLQAKIRLSHRKCRQLRRQRVRRECQLSRLPGDGGHPYPMTMLRQ